MQGLINRFGLKYLVDNTELSRITIVAAKNGFYFLTSNIIKKIKNDLGI